MTEPESNVQKTDEKRSDKLNTDIIKMKKQHISAVSAIEAEVFSVPWSYQAFENTLSMEEALFYVAVSEGKVTGYCGLYLAADQGEITNVASAPGYRRQSIAQKLLHTVMTKAHQQGAQRIFLEVRSQNDPAVSLYQKTGFQTVGRRKNYYQYPQDDALVMMYEYADI